MDKSAIAIIQMLISGFAFAREVTNAVKSYRHKGKKLTNTPDRLHSKINTD